MCNGKDKTRGLGPQQNADESKDLKKRLYKKCRNCFNNKFFPEHEELERTAWAMVVGHLTAAKRHLLGGTYIPISEYQLALDILSAPQDTFRNFENNIKKTYIEVSNHTDFLARPIDRIRATRLVPWLNYLYDFCIPTDRKISDRKKLERLNSRLNSFFKACDHFVEKKIHRIVLGMETKHIKRKNPLDQNEIQMILTWLLLKNLGARGQLLFKTMKEFFPGLSYCENSSINRKMNRLKEDYSTQFGKDPDFRKLNKKYSREVSAEYHLREEKRGQKMIKNLSNLDK